MSTPGPGLTIDEESFVPLPEQIRRGIVDLITGGTLSVGDRLVTVRQLARDLQLAPGTVAKGYQLLEADGVVETRGRRGTFVAARPVAAGPERAMSDAAASYLAVVREHGLSVSDAVAVLMQVYADERV